MNYAARGSAICVHAVLINNPLGHVYAFSFAIPGTMCPLVDHYRTYRMKNWTIFN